MKRRKKSEILPSKEVSQSTNKIISPRKRLDDYEQHKPVQMELFESLLPEDKNLSSTIEFYDFCPKYVYWRMERLQDKFLDRIEREFECRNSEYRLRLTRRKSKTATA